MLMKLPTWLRASLITAFQSFIGALIAFVLSLLKGAMEWVEDGTVPDWSIGTKVFASAVLAIVIGLVTAAYRLARPVENTYPEAPVGDRAIG